MNAQKEDECIVVWAILDGFFNPATEGRRFEFSSLGLCVYEVGGGWCALNLKKTLWNGQAP